MNETTRKTLMSSDLMNWRTPPELFRPLNEEFGFHLDAAASDANALCPAHFTEADNALCKRWRGVVWCNPPYGRTIGQWTHHARSRVEAGDARTVVMLIPARTDTRWWHDDVMKAQAVRLIRGRVRFLNDEGCRMPPAPFPSALVIWQRWPLGATRIAPPRFSAYRFEAAA